MNHAPRLVLGIESSCDETAVALVDESKTIRSHVVVSQLDDHEIYGGVVPEIAARAHLACLDRLVARAMAEAKATWSDLDGVAATAGPGLIGGVMVGLMTAKAIAFAHEKPLIAVNHLEGHALSPRLVSDLDFPYLLLLVSGGHCQILVAEGVDNYRRWGSTIDDAVGEAFDKTAKLLGLNYPGGPAVERAARQGYAERFAFPRPLLDDKSLNFSFSGLKTAVRRQAEALFADQGSLTEQDRADICAGFQAAVGDCLADRLARAVVAFAERYPGRDTPLVIAGGVAANQALRTRLAEVAGARGVLAPPPWLCTDNGAMIAWAGVERLQKGLTDAMDVAARPRWPLDKRAEPAYGTGRKGAKA